MFFANNDENFHVVNVYAFLFNGSIRESKRIAPFWISRACKSFTGISPALQLLFAAIAIAVPAACPNANNYYVIRAQTLQLRTIRQFVHCPLHYETRTTTLPFLVNCLVFNSSGNCSMAISWINPSISIARFSNKSIAAGIVPGLI